MTDVAHVFDDGAAYERYMGRWTHAAGAKFLDWLAPPAGALWLDVGCGTGVFTELVTSTCSPAAVTAIDPAQAQVDHARRQPVGQRADFQVADAQALPFADSSFDVVVSALVINFIPDRPRALAEMRRVSRLRGVVAGYVWDFAADRAPNSALRLGLHEMGIEHPPMPGTEASRIEALSSLFAQTGLEDIATRTIDVTMSFAGFDDFWRSLTTRLSPVIKVINSLPEIDRVRLTALVREGLPARPDGSIACSARANAIKARVPG